MHVFMHPLKSKDDLGRPVKIACMFWARVPGENPLTPTDKIKTHLQSNRFIWFSFFTISWRWMKSVFSGCPLVHVCSNFTCNALCTEGRPAISSSAIQSAESEHSNLWRTFLWFLFYTGFDACKYFSGLLPFIHNKMGFLCLFFKIKFLFCTETNYR